jgi:hypothetical protein
MEREPVVVKAGHREVARYLYVETEVVVDNPVTGAVDDREVGRVCGW